MSDKPVEDWTPAELARWMAERDGWYGVGITDNVLVGWHADNPTSCTAAVPFYPVSLDAAVEWLSRMGLEWERTKLFCGPMCVRVYIGVVCELCIETPDRPTAHALCIAGVKAKMAQESGDD